MAALTGVLMPLASMITQNIPEAECLCDVKINTRDDMQKAARAIAAYYKGAILITGGHLEESSDDLLYADGAFTWFRQKHIDNPNTHGTGCTLSSAIACNLAHGLPMTQCVQNAKDYVTGALAAGLDLGKGRGPLDHCWQLPPVIS
jgi:hydroxymethylpyrimidine/phosphomethylpyrimidine kinase